MLRVVITEAARRAIREHVYSTTSREVGGVLVGPVATSGPVAITSSIKAIDADEAAASMTFTQASWEHIYRELDELEGMAIVGWYHSHPGFGIFLSEKDLFIHRNFFSGKRQIAYVVDPIRDEHGAFAWDEPGDDISRLKPSGGSPSGTSPR